MRGVRVERPRRGRAVHARPRPPRSEGSPAAAPLRSCRSLLSPVYRCQKTAGLTIAIDCITLQQSIAAGESPWRLQGRSRRRRPTRPGAHRRMLGSVTPLVARRDGADARPAPARDHGGLRTPHARLRPRGAADGGRVRDRASISSTASARRPTTPTTRASCSRTPSASRRSSACSTTAATARPKRRRRCSGRSGAMNSPRTENGGSIVRSRHAGPGALRRLPHHRPAGPAARRRRGRRLAGLAGRPLREPGRHARPT